MTPEHTFLIGTCRECGCVLKALTGFEDDLDLGGVAASWTADGYEILITDDPSDATLTDHSPECSVWDREAL